MKRSILLAVTLPTLVLAASPPTPAAMLAGRTAGAEQDCIADFDRDRGGQLFKDGSIVYRGRSDTLYLNHPGDCPAFYASSAIESRTPTGRLCRGDILRVVDNQTGASEGSCALGGFTPYARAR